MADIETMTEAVAEAKAGAETKAEADTETMPERSRKNGQEKKI